jgi:beta-glucosidase/6-phospho-beta-glucosidase/beta-galactosidase
MPRQTFLSRESFVDATEKTTKETLYTLPEYVSNIKMLSENKLIDSVNWLYRQWANLHRLKQDGVPIVGFTWYSLTHQVDWDTALREDNGHIHEVGLYDLERNITPVGHAYKRLIHQWHEVLANESFGMVYTH